VAREVEAVKEIATLVSQPLVVDELSLIRAGPVRVQGRCRKSSAINGSIEFFVNGEETFLRFEVEDPKSFGKGRKGGPPGPGKPDDKDGKYDEDRDKFPKSDKYKKGNGKFDRLDKIDKESSSHDGSMEKGIEECNKEPSKDTGLVSYIHPIAAFHPEKGMLNLQNG